MQTLLHIQEVCWPNLSLIDDQDKWVKWPWIKCEYHGHSTWVSLILLVDDQFWLNKKVVIFSVLVFTSNNECNNQFVVDNRKNYYLIFRWQMLTQKANWSDFRRAWFRNRGGRCTTLSSWKLRKYPFYIFELSNKQFPPHEYLYPFQS